MASLNVAFKTGKLSISQRQGIISLIPKVENNIPITLLNFDYKILARNITKIEPKLPKLVHSDQTGFAGKRTIYQPDLGLLNDLINSLEYCCS